MKHMKLILLAFSVLFITSCKETTKDVETTDEVTTEVTETKTSISIAPLTDSPAYAEAKLLLGSDDTMTIAEAGEVDFDFELENYVLGDQTDSPNAQKLANSGKGQHIHFIVNNQPYSAHYEAKFKKEIPAGVHHLVAFLSRSYHESVKNDRSVVVKKLVVGNEPQDSIGIDVKAPTLIYSRPKGTYKGKDAESILLDFFVLNTELSATGNKVIATINGEEFTIAQWAPHIISGLPMGEVTIQLKLVDANGELVPGPFNSVERQVTLAAE